MKFDDVKFVFYTKNRDINSFETDSENKELQILTTYYKQIYKRVYVLHSFIDRLYFDMQSKYVLKWNLVL